MSESSIEVSVSKDGSQTLYSSQFDQHYHSMHGAINESEHVFIKHGLHRLIKPNIKLLEFGFGSGLNALLSMREAYNRGLLIDYYGLELYPVVESVWSQLNYGIRGMEDLQADFTKMHAGPWEEKIVINERFTLSKLQADFLDADLPIGLDLVYFDAFGPGTQPELWQYSLFERIYSAMNTGGVFTTYSCKGDVRRALMALGFEVEKPIGPPGKRSMLVGTKV